MNLLKNTFKENVFTKNIFKKNKLTLRVDSALTFLILENNFFFNISNASKNHCQRALDFLQKFYFENLLVTDILQCLWGEVAGQRE